MKKLSISYNPDGSGDEYGIRIKGDLATFLKLWKRLIIEKELSMPLDSHHGQYFFLEDYGVSLSIAMKDWTHANKGNGIGYPMFILYQSKYTTTITEHGQSDHKNIGIPLSMKKGFKKMLENCGFTIATSWNDDHAGESVSVVVQEKITFDALTSDKSLKILLEKLKDACETLDAVSH